jgi:hypothetical protein
MIMDARNTIQQNYVDRSAIDNTRLTGGVMSVMWNCTGVSSSSTSAWPETNRI